MDTFKQHRYVSLVGPRPWPGIAFAMGQALSAAEYEGWPLAPTPTRHQARGATPGACDTRSSRAPRG